MTTEDRHGKSSIIRILTNYQAALSCHPEPQAKDLAPKWRGLENPARSFAALRSGDREHARINWKAYNIIEGPPPISEGYLTPVRMLQIRGERSRCFGEMPLSFDIITAPEQNFHHSEFDIPHSLFTVYSPGSRRIPASPMSSYRVCGRVFCIARASCPSRSLSTRRRASGMPR